MENAEPQTLYHYTSAFGLRGILTRKNIWASNVLYLNDAQEYKYAAELVNTEITNLNPPPEELTRLFLNDIQTTLRNIDPNRDSAANPPTLYVASFAQDGGDSLSQWRAYAPNGNGYSIGFDCRRLQDLTEPQGFHLTRCEYDTNRQLLEIRQLLTRVVDKFQGHHEVINSVQIYDEFMSDFLVLTAKMKNPAFSIEKEWRLVSEPPAPQAELKFRLGKATIIPYVEISLQKHPNLLELHDVCIGPTPYPNLSKNAIHLLKNSTRSSFDVRVSNIPHRAGPLQV